MCHIILVTKSSIGIYDISESVCFDIYLHVPSAVQYFQIVYSRIDWLCPIATVKLMRHTHLLFIEFEEDRFDNGQETIQCKRATGQSNGHWQYGYKAGKGEMGPTILG